MMTSMTKDENTAKQVQLMTEKQTLEIRLDTIEVELINLRSDICLWSFETHKDAEIKIVDKLGEQANDDCEGSYNCGKHVYDQNYTLTGSSVVYTGSVKVEYNRHDKTYYYVEELHYSFKESTK